MLRVVNRPVFCQSAASGCAVGTLLWHSLRAVRKLRIALVGKIERRRFTRPGPRCLDLTTMASVLSQILSFLTDTMTPASAFMVSPLLLHNEIGSARQRAQSSIVKQLSDSSDSATSPLQPGAGFRGAVSRPADCVCWFSRLVVIGMVLYAKRPVAAIGHRWLLSF